MDAETYQIGDQVRLKGIALTLLTRGTVDRGGVLLTVEDTTGYADGNPILVQGAGPLGSDLLTTIVQITGSVITLTAAATTLVQRARVGKPTNATTSVCRVRKPDQSFVTPDPTVSNPSPGVYTATVDPDLAGDWYYRFVFTGTAKTAGQQRFVVAEQRVAS
jgi:hypothetical protein